MGRNRIRRAFSLLEVFVAIGLLSIMLVTVRVSYMKQPHRVAREEADKISAFVRDVHYCSIIYHLGADIVHVSTDSGCELRVIWHQSVPHVKKIPQQVTITCDQLEFASGSTTICMSGVFGKMTEREIRLAYRGHQYGVLLSDIPGNYLVKAYA